MKKFSVRIKEKNGAILTPVYIGDDSTTIEFVEDFFGVHEPDVEDYEIKEQNI